MMQERLNTPNEYQNQGSHSGSPGGVSTPEPLPPHGTHRVISYRRNLNFVYRSSIASRLDNLVLKTPHDCRGIALWGSSGFGKTQIALDFAYRRCGDPTCSVFWVCASGRTTFMRDFKKISFELGLNAELEGETLLRAVCKSIESKPRWLLVIDGADDLANLGGDPDSNSTKNKTNLLNYIPSSRTGITLWTSCDRGVLEIVGPPTGSIHVQQMTCEEALKFFEIARSQDISQREIISTMDLINQLGRHPLAILQAGVYLHLTSTEIDQYLLELDRVNVDRHINIFTNSDPQPESGVTQRIAKAVGTSIQNIQDQSWIATNILHVVSNLSNKEISLSMIRAITLTCMRRRGESPDTVEQEVEAALILLRKYSFLYMATEESGDLNFEMPKVIQEVAQVTSANDKKITNVTIAMNINSILQTVHIGAGGSGGPQGDRDDANTNVSFLRMALEITNYCLNKSIQEMESECEKYLNHTLRLCKLAESRKETSMAVGLLNLLSGYFLRNQLWENLTVVALRALELTTEVFGERHVETLWSMGNLASSFYQQGRYGEAQDILEHLLELRQDMLGLEHSHTMWTMSTLGVAYGMQGEHEKAEKIFQSLLSLQRDTVGERHPDTIVNMCNLATTFHSQGCFDQAEELLTSVLALTTTESQHKHLDISQVRYKLSLVQQSRALAGKTESIE